MTATTTTDVRNVPDTASYLAIHRAMRTANEQLVTGLVQAPYYAPKRAAAIGRWFEGYATELHTHHSIEDDIIFPALAERAADYAAKSDSLTADHRRLDELIDGIRTAVAGWAAGGIDDPATGAARATAIEFAVELRDLLAVHLDIEDQQVIPMFHEHFTAEEFAVFEEAAMKAITLKHALFTVPWFMASIDAETGRETLEQAPFMLKMIYRISRRGYARLARTAFGAVS